MYPFCSHKPPQIIVFHDPEADTRIILPLANFQYLGEYQKDQLQQMSGLKDAGVVVKDTVVLNTSPHFKKLFKLMHSDTEAPMSTGMLNDVIATAALVISYVKTMVMTLYLNSKAGEKSGKLRGTSKKDAQEVRYSCCGGPLLSVGLDRLLLRC